MKKITFLSIVTLFFLSLSACGSNEPTEPTQEPVVNQESEQAPMEESEDTEESVSETNLKEMGESDSLEKNAFDLAHAKVGDEVAGMKIAQLDLAEKSLLPWGSKVTFKGQTEVTGEYTYYDDDEPFLGGNVCLRNLTEESLDQLPKVIGDSRDVWFCFSNFEEAQAEFGPAGSTGTATVMIDDYYIPMIEGEAWKVATLVKVVEKE